MTDDRLLSLINETVESTMSCLYFYDSRNSIVTRSPSGLELNTGYGHEDEYNWLKK